ncbi:hypothetical protein [Salmonirosea aquatica]
MLTLKNNATVKYPVPILHRPAALPGRTGPFGTQGDEKGKTMQKQILKS